LYRILISTLCLFVLCCTVQAAGADLPQLIKYSGTLATGSPQASAVFALYKNATGGAPLWQEVQSIAVDATGRYTVLLGARSQTGIPSELFAAGDARWLGVTIQGQSEQPRVLLVSVPYAMKAGDAESVGGAPLSALVQRGELAPAAFVNAAAVTSAAKSAVAAAVSASTMAGNLTMYTDTTGTVGGSALFQGTFSNNGGTSTGVAVNATAPLGTLHLLDSNTTMRIENYAGANGGSPNFNFYSANGTATSPIGTYAGDNIGQFAASGYIPGSGWPGSSKAKISFVAADQWSSGDQSTMMTFSTTPVNTTKRAVQMIIDGNGNVGIGNGTSNNPSMTDKLYVVGNIHTTGGVVFPDNSIQTTAYIGGTGPAGVTSFNGRTGAVVPASGDYNMLMIAPPTACATGQLLKWNGTNWFCFTSTAASSVANGGGVTGAIANNVLTLGSDSTVLQQRVTGTCGSNSAIASIAQNGTVGCQSVGSGGGSITLPVSWSASNATGGIVNATNTAAGPVPSSKSTPGSTVAPVALTGTASGTGTTVGVFGQATGTSASDLGIGVFGSTPTGIAIMGYSSYSGDMPTIMAWAGGTSGKTAGFDAELYSPSATAYRVNFNVAPTSGYVFEANNDVTNTNIFQVDGSGNLSTAGTISAGGQANFGSLGTTLVNGNLTVNGNLSKSSGTFKIDHPLDPANKYLYHSFVESPDMKNVYDGLVVLDNHGHAVVELPDYFEALNQDYRYQLTAIGVAAPKLHIARKVSQNHFEIAGGKPGMEVSWQVTGVRHDAYANAHRIQVEEDKGEKRGTYLHPELFQPEPAKTAQK
jgi:hypothetical protein